jgi:rubrerythrin
MVDFCPKCGSVLIKSNLKLVKGNYYCAKCNTPVRLAPRVKKFEPKKPGIEIVTKEAKKVFQRAHDEQMKIHFVIKGELAKCIDRTEHEYTEMRNKLAKKYGWETVKKCEEELLKRYPRTKEFFQRVAKEAGYKGWGRGEEYVCRKCGHIWKVPKE